MINFQFLKGCLPQILLGPFLNTLTYTEYPFLQEIYLKIFWKIFKNNQELKVTKILNEVVYGFNQIFYLSKKKRKSQEKRSQPEAQLYLSLQFRLRLLQHKSLK